MFTPKISIKPLQILGFIAASLSFLLTTQFAYSNNVSVNRITPENAQDLIKGGPDAIGGIGDWHFSNGTLCAVISDISHEAEFSANGGSLVDLGFCNRDDDHFLFFTNLLDGSRKNPIENQSISISGTADNPVISVLGVAQGVTLETHYSFDSENQTELNISKTLTRVNGEVNNFNLFSTLYFNYHSLQTFVFSSANPQDSPGFDNQEFVTRGMSAISVAAHNADTIIYLSPPTAEHRIAYGWRTKSLTRRDGSNEDKQYSVPYYALADHESTAFLSLSDELWLGDGSQLGLLQLPQIPFMNLDQGASLHFEESIYVGAQADAASITDQILTESPKISGTTSATDSAIHVEYEGGAPLTYVRSDQDGNFSFRAPPGNYVLRHVAQADRSKVSKIEVSDQKFQTLPAMELPKAATLLLPRGEAMRLLFEGINGTEDPDFVDHLTDYSVEDDQGKHTRPKVPQLYLTGSSSDAALVEIPAGEYRVTATKGLEYGVTEAVISIAAGENKSLSIKIPQRQIETPGYIAADLHVHAGNSFDNTFSNAERVKTFVAEHGEVMVASEHDTMFDFAPLIKEMQLDDKITSIVGTELTSLLTSGIHPNTGGHINFFPVQPQPLAYRKGVAAHENIRLGELIDIVRDRNPGVFSQLNHARRNFSLSNEIPEEFEELIDDGAFFDHMGRAAHPYQPDRPLSTFPNNTLLQTSASSKLRDIDFDAMEIINPGGDKHQERLDAVTKDWVSLLLQGEQITGTANSDSHNKLEQVAVPRNMVAVQGDSVQSFKVSELVQSLKAGNSYGTTGPMFEIALSGTKMGGYHQGRTANLSVDIFSVDWINVSKLHVFINGMKTQELDLVGNTKINLDLEFNQDSFVRIELSGPISETYEKLYPGLSPFAFSNPIYVDHDSDGQWLPPGLPSPEQGTLPSRPIKQFQQITEVNMLEHEKINYLEYRAHDLEATKQFFETVFDWEFVDYGPDYTAFSNQGVDGGFERAKLHSDSTKGAALTVFYSNDLESTQAKVIAAGGRVTIEIFSFPGGRRFHFVEPSGNEFAVWSDR